MIPFVKRLNQIDEYINQFNQFDFLSENKLLLQPAGKVVQELDGKIYKLYPLMEGYSRKMIGEVFANLGAPIFLETEVVDVFPNFNAILMTEPKVKVIHRITRDELQELFDEKGYNPELIDRFGLNFYQVENCGYYKDELKIFDAIWNVYPVIRKDTGTIRLQDLKGNLLLEEELHERYK